MINDIPSWNRAWLGHAEYYTPKALALSNSRFYIPRLTAYAAYMKSDNTLRERAWKKLIPGFDRGELRPFEVKEVLPPEVLYPQVENERIGTNGVATWSLDAIYMLEVTPPDK